MTQKLLHDVSENTLISAGTAAEMLACDRSTITRLVQSGRLTPVQYIDHGAHRVLLFASAAVENLRAVRAGEIGDVLDRVDVAAAADDPTEDRNAYVRAAWMEAIRTVVAGTGGTFHSGQLRAHLPDDVGGKAPGALITGLVRSKRIEWTGETGTLSDHRARHAATLCKQYRVIGDLA